ncbi:MAG TPA: hypothetical protein VJV78_41720 [Polyangiales bacterium]|nr:hypothetical protein [Polyangiales bacterium]
MVRTESTRTYSAGGSLAAQASRAVDNLLALVSIGMVGAAALFAVYSWIEPGLVKIMLFALMYLLARSLLGSLFEPGAHSGLGSATREPEVVAGDA